MKSGISDIHYDLSTNQSFANSSRCTLTAAKHTSYWRTKHTSYWSPLHTFSLRLRVFNI